MKKTSAIVFIGLIMVLTLSFLVKAQFEVIFPFMETQVDDYYIRSEITTHFPLERSHVVGAYKKGDLVVSVIEIFDQKVAFGYNAEEDWIPAMEDYLDLFFSNYEMRLVGVETVAGLETLIIELVSKKTGMLRHKYLLDQRTGLVLSQFVYDRAGNLMTSYKALEVDYDPDFSALDLNMVELGSALSHYPISEAQLEALLPWFDLNSLALPVDFQVVGYSQMDPGGEYPDGTRILVWASDGYESLVLEIAFADHGQIIFDQNTILEIVEHMPSSIIAEVVGQPVAFSLHGPSLELDEVTTMLSSLSPAKEIANPEALRFEMFVRGETLLYPFDYNAIPQEALSETEFFELAPMAFKLANAFPQNLEVVGYAKVSYSDDQKSTLAIYERYPDMEIEDLVIILSDGERFHHVGLSFAPNYTDYKHRGQSTRRFQSWVIVLFDGWPISFFSHSTFLSYEEQLDIIEELGKGYIINPK